MEMVYKLIMDIVVVYMYQRERQFHKDKLLQQLAQQEIQQVRTCI